MFNIYFHRIQIRMDTGTDIRNITPALQRAVSNGQIRDGSLHATVIGSTGSITAIEFEPGVVEDLKRTINAIAPPHLDYAHEKAWHDGNGHSHVQAALIGPSIVLPVRNGQLTLGTWQQVVLINHDTRPRDRTVELTLMGSMRNE